MLYMVGKIFMYGVSFDIVYNEMFHENKKKLEKNIFFATEFRNKYHSF